MDKEYHHRNSNQLEFLLSLGDVHHIVLLLVIFLQDHGEHVSRSKKKINMKLLIEKQNYKEKTNPNKIDNFM